MCVSLLCRRLLWSCNNFKSVDKCHYDLFPDSFVESSLELDCSRSSSSEKERRTRSYYIYRHGLLERILSHKRQDDETKREEYDTSQPSTIIGFELFLLVLIFGSVLKEGKTSKQVVGYFFTTVILSHNTTRRRRRKNNPEIFFFNSRIVPMQKKTSERQRRFLIRKNIIE